MLTMLYNDDEMSIFDKNPSYKENFALLFN